MNLLALQVGKVQQVAASLLSPASFFSAPQVAVALALAIVYLAYRQQRRRGAIRLSVILRAMRSRRILSHRSTSADVFYFFVNTFAIGGLIGWGIFSGSAVSEWSLRILRTMFGPCAPVSAPEWLLRTGITLAVFLAYEFGYFVDHYLKHKVPVLWELHKVHHSAEVLTPLTVFRVHPIDSLIFIDIVAIATGLAHALFTYAAGRGINLYVVDGTNVITVAFLFLLAQLQHSQFWIPLRGIPGRLILSPAHHQIHHSLDPSHYDKNLGSFLAIWDWMFGTLHIPQQAPLRLRFGVAHTSDDPHRIFSLIVDPVINALRMLRVMPEPIVQRTRVRS